MPTNANTFNSRITSEALEKKFRDVFPAQGGAELIQDLYAAGTIQPVIDFSSVAEGSNLGTNLQTAWDFSTSWVQSENTTTTIVSNTGFWKVNLQVTWENVSGAAYLRLTDGLSTKTLWYVSGATANNQLIDDVPLIVFLRSGDSLTQTSSGSGVLIRSSVRQIADVNGNLVNPLGFTFS